MKKRKAKLFIIIFIILAIIFMISLILTKKTKILLYINNASSFVDVADKRTISEYGNYFGRIHYSSKKDEVGKVVIRDIKNDKEILSISFDEFDMEPDSIELGERGFYLVESYKKSKIVGVTYEGNILGEYTIHERIGNITCKNGVLFLEENKSSWIEGFSTTKYLNEKDFSKKKWIQIRNQSNQKRVIEKVPLYFYEKGFWATEPQVNDSDIIRNNFVYGGVISDELVSGEKNAIRKLIYDYLIKNDMKGMEFEIIQYQYGKKVYGCVNCYNSNSDIKDNLLLCDIEKSYSFYVDLDSKCLKIQRTFNGEYLILSSQDFVIYQQYNKVFKLDLETKKNTLLYEISDLDNLEYIIHGEYLNICEDLGEEIFVKLRE